MKAYFGLVKLPYPFLSKCVKKEPRQSSGPTEQQGGISYWRTKNGLGNLIYEVMTAAAVIHSGLMSFMTFGARERSFMLPVGINFISPVCLFYHGLIVAMTRSTDVQVTTSFQLIVRCVAVRTLHASGNMPVSEIGGAVCCKSSRTGQERKE